MNNFRIIRPYFDQETKKEPKEEPTQEPDRYIRGEWIVTNGLGGYASSTVIGVRTRKYHALLIAALPPPYGRTIMLNHLREEIFVNEKSFLLNCEETKEGLDLSPLAYLKLFYLEDGLPVWKYEMEGIVIEKRIFMAYRQNTIYISYKLISGADELVLNLRPALHFRSHEAPVNTPFEEVYPLTVIGEHYEVHRKDIPPLRLGLFGASWTFTIDSKMITNVFFRMESSRGYESTGQLWSPGSFQLKLLKDKEIAFVASNEEWKEIYSLEFNLARKSELHRRRLLHILSLPFSKDALVEELVLAADQFIIRPEHRIEDAVRAHAAGDEIRTIIAGYHWFNDWGRDTMISLEGLTLCTGREQEARWILKTFAHYVRDGLIPNMFPEGKNEGLYHTADATLWFFHAINRYLQYTSDNLTLEELIPILQGIIHYHIQGTRFNIGMDPKDSLIKQGAEGYQLTWMDAKVGDWVVTPRRGKPVEINALWYNALKLMEGWMILLKNAGASTFYGQLANKVRVSFNERFWISDKGYLYDVLDGEKGNDDAFRPNQLFAFSLDFPVLEDQYWKSVVDKCEEKLVTPYGLRTLSCDHPDFKPRYAGDLRSRDAAYHQGTVWPWLFGPFIDAYLKVYPDKKRARQFLADIDKHLADVGVGTISEICDAVEPYFSQGCIAQAWSVAEVLRTWIKTHELL